MINFNQFEFLSFDCYGTLIDWETGIIQALTPILAGHSIELSPERLIKVYAECEAELEKSHEGHTKYREVLRQVVAKFGEKLEFEPTEAEKNSLPDSLKNWRPFSDTLEALKALKKRYKLTIISNTDDDLFAETAKHLQVEFDEIVTAEQVKSYKPSHRNFEVALERMGISQDKLLHIAQSVYHDIVPAKALGISAVWVNRQGFDASLPATGQPDLEVPDLKTLVQLMG